MMDEPATGLHMADTSRLLKIIYHRVDQGNSVIVIEHNSDVIRQADWIIDMGPQGGNNGGEIIATGNPETLMENPGSVTSVYMETVSVRNNSLVDGAEEELVHE